VTDFFKNIDLTGHSLDIALALDAIFLKNFDCDFLAGDGVGSYPDLAERSLSQRSPYIFVSLSFETYPQRSALSYGSSALR